MDIRGIEVTNQLRSAIRAKLLELGVRYDEELPDYILVMVVNKKTRQQMYEDLCLFLEDSTSPFVDWLHDQVLKKLQKVTVAKKKSSRELVPTVIVKQEEERKKKKTCPTSFLEDQITDTLGTEKKLPKKIEKVTKPNETDAEKVENAVKAKAIEGESSSLRKTTNSSIEPLSKSSIDAEIDVKMSEISSRNSKNIVDEGGRKIEESIVDPRPSEREEEAEEESEDEDSRRKVKSSVNKPRITSVVTVKNRLEFPPRHQFDAYNNKPEFDGRYRKTVRGVDRHEFDGNRRGDTFRNNRGDDHFRRNLGKGHDFEARIQDSERADVKSRLGNIREDKFNKVQESRSKSTEKFSNSVKDRLGAGTSVKVRDNPLNKKSSTEEARNPKDRLAGIKNRLGPVKNVFKSPDVRRRFNASEKRASSEDEGSRLAAEDTDDDEGVAPSVGPVKSRIIAVKRSVTDRNDRKRSKLSKDVGTEAKDEDDDVEDGKIASKVIVTPRPLKPLQPIQKRATQSLLLRAVAEANQSVVKQKNPEPVLTEKTTAPKRPAPIKMREGQNLSVRLNSSKRLVMEKIQVELTTGESELDNLPEPYVPQPVTDEHMGVVMSLFQRSNDSQKFLVTLNGYNNNGLKEKSVSDEDERLEMEVNEDDDFLLGNSNSEEYIEGKSLNGFQMIDMESVQSIDKTQTEENIENLNIGNIEIDEDLPRKKRKLSPIVYNRSTSSSPLHTKPIITPTVSVKHLERQIPVENSPPSVTDKSKEKCRYWPNCTLGIKCPYYHPAALCSAFPACKFGEKCLYKHPKCKFGLSCTKLGCAYRHPPRQCKYHPYCTNPTCTYTHPLPKAQPVEVVSNRAKFTWRKHE